MASCGAAHLRAGSARQAFECFGTVLAFDPRHSKVGCVRPARQCCSLAHAPLPAQAVLASGAIQQEFGDHEPALGKYRSIGARHAVGCAQSWLWAECETRTACLMRRGCWVCAA